jgi:hypothetical protein
MAYRENFSICIEDEAHDRYDTTVNRLILVLRDFYPARLDRAALEALPRLEALERWLARGDIAPVPGGWRDWLWREFALKSPLAPDANGRADGVAPAAVAAAAVPNLPAGKPLWFATPVHFVAGLDTVRLHPAGLLELDGEAQLRLAADFARVFNGSGFSLHATGRREMLLAGGALAAPNSTRNSDPAMWLGADPREGFPAGAQGAELRRLGAEIEMWLHEHPVNQARAARGELAASALWLWGGGTQAVICATRPAPAASAWAEDAYVDGLARVRAVDVQAPPERWPYATAGLDQPGELLVVFGTGAAPHGKSLVQLDLDWIAPALEKWEQGHIGTATLLAGERAITLPALGRWRRWWRGLRTSRPWWEVLLR